MVENGTILHLVFRGYPQLNHKKDRFGVIKPP